MKRFPKTALLASVTNFISHPNKLIPFLLLGVFCWIFPTSLFAAKAVKPLSNKVLKNIEEKYDKETRNLFSGKDSESNVLALKRLIAEEVQPDVAIAAILKYDESKRYRSGSLQRREAIGEMEALFATSNIHWKKGRDIVMRAGTAIHARTVKSELHTSRDPNEPICRNKKVVSKRTEKVTYQDPDQLVENVLLTQLTGRVNHDAPVAVI